MADRWRNLLGRLAGGEDTVKARADLLSRLDLFARLSERQRRRLAEALLLRRYAAGEILIQQGDTGLGMFILLAGQWQWSEHKPAAPSNWPSWGRGNL